MWNMYEDGDVFNSSIRREVSAGMATILGNCYKSMQGLQDGETGENSYKPSRDKAILDDLMKEVDKHDLKEGQKFSFNKRTR